MGSGANVASSGAIRQHLVQLYQSDAFMCEIAADYLGAGLAACEPLVVIAVAEHRRAIVRRLARHRYDVDAIVRSGQLALLDAHETLARVATGGFDADACTGFYGEVLARALQHANGGRIRIYGEVAGLLWERRDVSACRQLEACCETVFGRIPSTMLCAYRMAGDECAAEVQLLEGMCALHTHTLPSEQCTTSADLENRLRHLFMLEQRVRNQEHELARARDLERKLRQTLKELHAPGSPRPSSAPSSRPHRGRSERPRRALCRAEATLRIFSTELSPEDIGLRLDLEPTWVLEEPTFDESGPRRPHGWFLSSKQSVPADDLDSHLDWLLTVIERSSEALRALCLRRDVRADIACLWVSAVGHGGPTIAPEPMARLAALGLSCTFDVYVEGDG